MIMLLLLFLHLIFFPQPLLQPLSFLPPLPPPPLLPLLPLLPWMKNTKSRQCRMFFLIFKKWRQKIIFVLFIPVLFSQVGCCCALCIDCCKLCVCVNQREKLLIPLFPTLSLELEEQQWASHPRYSLSLFPPPNPDSSSPVSSLSLQLSLFRPHNPHVVVGDFEGEIDEGGLRVCGICLQEGLFVSF